MGSITGYVALMDWQQVASLAIVGIAAGLLVRRRFRRSKFNFQRDSPCCCSAAQNPSPNSSIVFRARKGERAEVRVKMK
jgi:hypothetical protein